MSYSISISGHIEGTAEEAKAAEEKIAEKVKRLVPYLEGCQSAAMSGQHVGFINLLPPVTQTQKGS